VWSLLYLQMAVAAWLTWRRLGDWRAFPLRLFGVQLALNVGWSALFFGARRPDLAVAEILLLGCTIGGTVASFWRTSWVAGALLLPYLLWVGFAAALNFAVWRENS
jgi:tryptophan-rich sensory protein